MNQCTAIKPNGERCTLAPTGQHGLCWAHDPANREMRRRTASKGGRSKANREVVLLEEELKALIGRVEDSDVSAPRGNTMIRGYSVLIDLIKLERGIHLEDDLAARIEELKRERPHAS
jgi:hypothetical protein